MDPTTPLVYVVDDDSGVRAALALLIEASGWQARTFASAPAFLERLHEPHPDRACLLLDLQMPKMNGAELKEHLRDRGMDLPTVALTAAPDGPLAARALAAGAQLVLVKPADPARLKAALFLALEGSAGCGCRIPQGSARLPAAHGQAPE